MFTPGWLDDLFAICLEPYAGSSRCTVACVKTEGDPRHCGGTLAGAWSYGTMFRGIERILRGRDPSEAWIWGATRLRRVHDGPRSRLSQRGRGALGIEVPDGARLVRNIIAAVIPVACGCDTGHR